MPAEAEGSAFENVKKCGRFTIKNSDAAILPGRKGSGTGDRHRLRGQFYLHRHMAQDWTTKNVSDTQRVQMCIKLEPTDARNDLCAEVTEESSGEQTDQVCSDQTTKYKST